MFGSFWWLPYVIIMGGLCRRICGGVLNQWLGYSGVGNDRLTGDFWVRVAFAVAIANAALVGGCPWYLALALVPAVWVGTTLGNLGGKDMGTAPNGPGFWSCLARMTGHGLASAVLPCLVAASPDIWAAVNGAAWAAVWQADSWRWMLAGNAACGLSYALGLLAFKAWPVTGWRYPAGFQAVNEAGEWTWGAAVALGAFFAYAA